ncbi:MULTISPECIES: hypothetical protein [unclassified Paenibacillus]|uniref:hypothetical protein n=1 Tax=unclassified Paenibacillus TaxID=185978 RepID=UPI0027863B1C|nr:MULTISPECIES: hypothetical protein [unclassified Paenibacillus]MDQ0902686.1 hypothetical protein [Paenibacillus sp. V4I7]MDQ0918802.1 hypothetical protein [Paenibacillus sp. V4I5]
MNYPPTYYTSPYSPYDRYPIPAAYYPVYWAWHRDFPPVDTKILSHSLASSQKLLRDASLLLQKLADPTIARQLMTNAQSGNQKEVDRIVHTFGTESIILTSYSPSSVRFTIDPRVTEKPCCEIVLSLKWGE